MALALRVLGEDQVARPADETLARARLDLEDAAGQENQLAARRIVQVLDPAFGGLAEEEGARLERRRHGPRAGHRHLAQLDRRVPRPCGVDSDNAHPENITPEMTRTVYGSAPLAQQGFSRG